MCKNRWQNGVEKSTASTLFQKKSVHTCFTTTKLLLEAKNIAQLIPKNIIPHSVIVSYEIAGKSENGNVDTVTISDLTFIQYFREMPIFMKNKKTTRCH